MKRNEKETREQLIDPKLKLADWDIVYKKGVIENVAQAQALLIRAMEIGINEGETVGRIVIGIPGDASEVEKNAAEEIGRKAGAEYVLVVSEGLAAAIALTSAFQWCGLFRWMLFFVALPKAT